MWRSKFSALRRGTDPLCFSDNRDASNDSRYIGPVPRKLLIGHANHIVLSADILGNWMPRFGRTGEKIK